MAVRHEEVPLEAETLSPDLADKGAWLYNVERFADYWRVRKGFGQRAQFDSTLAFGSHGPSTMLGARVIKTDFGHEQVVVVSLADSFTGGNFAGSNARDIGAFGDVCLVHVYDLTTDDLYEVLLHPHTSQQTLRNDQRHALYETDRTRSTEAYRFGRDEPVWFTELNDILLFGSVNMGVWAYRPAIFSGPPRPQQVNSVDQRHGHYQAYGEEAIVSPVSFGDGLFAEGFAYFQRAEVTPPRAAVAIGNRVAYAAGRTLYISDPGRPDAIIADNFLVFPSENEVTAMAEIGGNLVAFTDTETFFYGLPPSGVVLTGGRLIRSSPSIGCAGPQAVSKVEGKLVWVDRSGIHASPDGVGIETLSGGFKELWLSSISNPWSQFHQQSGATSLANTQPRSFYRYDPTMVHVAHDPIGQRLLISFPALDVALTLRDGRWSLWSFESVAAAANTVQALRNVTSPILLPAESGLFAVGSVESTVFTDDTVPGGTGAVSGEAPAVRSWYLLEYGRGGGVDRTAVPREDSRRVAGKWYNLDATLTTPVGTNAYYLGEPILLPDGFDMPNAGAMPVDVLLLPVEVYPDVASDPDRLQLRLRFDATHWVPIFTTGTSTVLDFLLPPERAASVAGWQANAAFSQVQCYNPDTGLPSRAGRELRVEWDGLQAGYVGPYAPLMNLNLRQRNRLIYLPMRYFGPAGDDVLSMGLLAVNDTTIIRTGGVYSVRAGVYAWQQGFRQDAYSGSARVTLDSRAQPVDYAIRPSDVDGDGAQLKARTLYLEARSRGNATTQVQPIAVHGQLNVLYGSDHKGWAAQVVDHAGDLEVNENVGPLRSRFRNNSSAMVQLTFNRADTAWGNPAVPATGNVLVADDPLDTLAISDSVKGERVFVQVFGHVRSIAEAIEFKSMKLAVVAAGQRRRTGR